MAGEPTMGGFSRKGEVGKSRQITFKTCQGEKKMGKKRKESVRKDIVKGKSGN